MKIHLLTDPYSSQALTAEIKNLFRNSKCGITVADGKKYTTKHLINIDRSFKDLQSKIDFKSFFNVCEDYRIYQDIPSSDFVVYLTSFTNLDDWFSAVKSSNIFIDTNGWEEITGKDKIYGITYQIVENIFQSSLKIDYDKTHNSKYIHYKSIGCINDFCQTKSEILLKIKTADICKPCRDRASELNVSRTLLPSIKLVIDYIQPKVKDWGSVENVEPERVMISEDMRVSIGEIEVTLPPLEKSILIYFIKKSKVSVRSLKNNLDDLLAIYKKMRKRAEKEDLMKLVSRKTDMQGKEVPNTYFEKLKSSLNKKLKEQLGEPLSKYYILYSEGKEIKVRITPDYLEERPHL